ncbi:unnamed protein product [Schistosoma turkestanicum]|nr:unnamed protein product [Schistosoma turkestanicum]
MSTEKDMRQLVSEFREYDSIFYIIKDSQSEFLKNGTYYNCDLMRPQIICVDACNDYVVLGWNNGFLSIYNKKSCKVTKVIQLTKFIKSRGLSSVIPVSLAVRSEARLVIICCCHKNVQAVGNSLSSQDFGGQSLVVLQSFSTPNDLELKLYPVNITNPHNNTLSGNIYVSPCGNTFITGDCRGMIAAFKYVMNETSYTSSILTAVPGSIVDLKLAKNYLLLITCRLLPELLCTSIIDDNDLSYYLFNMHTRKLIKLELNNLLPSSLELKLSCIHPTWLQVDNNLQFACSLTSTKQHEPNSSVTTFNHTHHSMMMMMVFCAIFIVQHENDHHNCNVALHTLLSIDCLSSSSLTSLSNCLSVLPLQMSFNYPMVINHQSIDKDMNWDQLRLCTLYEESGLYALSSNLIIYWTTSITKNQSLFTLIQLDQHNNIMKPSSIMSDIEIIPPVSTVDLLTYSLQLGAIQSMKSLWLKPCHNYVKQSRDCDTIGLEVWIVRQLPPDYELNNSEVIVLSTRPLRAHLIALAPNISYSDFYTNINQTELVRSKLQQLTNVVTTINTTTNNNTMSVNSRVQLSTASPHASSSSSSSSLSTSSASSVTSSIKKNQSICLNNSTVHHSLQSYSLGKRVSETFKMSAFIPWPPRLLQRKHNNQLCLSKQSSPLMNDYDIGIDACTLLNSCE